VAASVQTRSRFSRCALAVLASSLFNGTPLQPSASLLAGSQHGARQLGRSPADLELGPCTGRPGDLAGRAVCP
jgi:hypothetical protein